MVFDAHFVDWMRISTDISAMDRIHYYPYTLHIVLYTLKYTIQIRIPDDWMRNASILAI